MKDAMERFLEWSMDWIMLPILVVVMAGFGLGAIGGVGYGVYYLLKDDAPAEITVTIKPIYWACTSAYFQHHKAYSTFTKIRHNYPAYDSCECNQWTAYMVGQERPADAQCSNGWPVSELKGVRP